MIDVATRERDRYLARVAARLQGIDASDRDELLDDLRDHLTEVEAESEGELEAVLGPPERYAAELLDSAGLPSGSAGRLGRLRAAWSRDRARVQRVLGHPEVAASIAGLRQARPAWWVLRGWLSVVALDAVFASYRSGVAEVVPHVAGTRYAGVIAIAVAAAGSVWLGRRSTDTWARRVSIVGNAFLALLLVITAAQQSSAASRLAGGYHHLDAYTETAVLWPEGALHTADGQAITNLFPYGPDGAPLERVRLYDQDGRPVEIVVDETADGLALVTSYELDDLGRPVPHAYPQRQVERFDGGSAGASPWQPPATVAPLTEADRSAPEDAGPQPDPEPVPDQEPPVEETEDEPAASDPDGDGADTAEQGADDSGS